AAHYKISGARARVLGSRCCRRSRKRKCDEAGSNPEDSSAKAQGGEAMTALEALPAVLDRIDHDLEASLDRLFALLRIQSVSTDPAFAAHCRTAAEYVATDLRGLGFE